LSLEDEMSNAPNRGRLSLAIVAVVSLLFAPHLFGAKAKRIAKQGSHEPQRVMSLSENGPIVTLKLENGKVVDVAKSEVKIKDGSLSKATDRRKKEERLSVARLSEMSAANPNALPAIVTFSYKRDGTVRKAKVRLFATEGDMKAYLADRSERIAAARAAAQTREPHR
jgi:hypothetical protein